MRFVRYAISVLLTTENSDDLEIWVPGGSRTQGVETRNLHQ